MAAVKDVAKQVIDSLPAGATMDDIMHALYIRAKCERADRQIEEGRGWPRNRLSCGSCPRGACRR
ncbi:MAG: hypothetical protein FJ291_32030 [Planctomycetes bacterium]|nr:hypothetical protein [Planctomycetota bacterium]